ncbi:MAG: hypothetical protein IJ787_06880 [Bacilli bacterium]|nr:hypothetical protein [Bacilli bacterium]
MPEQKTPQILSGFVLKVIGLAVMLLDHLGLFLMNKYFGVNEGLYQMAYVFRCIGRIAMPLFALFTAEAVRYSKKPWSYLLRLFLMYAGISIALVIFIYAIPGNQGLAKDIGGNAFADLSLLALALILFRFPGAKKLLALLPLAFAGFVYGIQIYEYANAVTILWFPRFLRPDYSLLGLLIGIGFYFVYPLTDLFSKAYIQNMGISLEAYRETKSYRKMANIVGASLFFAVVAIFWGISYIGYNYDFRPYDNYLMQLQSYCLLAIPLIYLYSGARGYDSKPFRIFTYLFYPMHIAILFFIFSL